MKKKGIPYIASTLVADKSFAEMMKKTKGIPPCIEPGSLDGISLKVRSLEEPVFQFKEIKPREKNKISDKEVIKLTDENMYEAFYNLGLKQGRELKNIVSEDELNDAYARGEKYGRTAGAKNELEYLICKVEGIMETDKRKQQLDDELEFAYKFAINLLNGELNKYKSYV